MTDDPIIRLPRGVRLHHDRVRNLPVLLGPERALMLDDIGLAILSELHDTPRLSALITRLAARYDAPATEITTDVRAFLDDLQVQSLVDYDKESSDA
ncbi:MAG: pyrroloquinoline quinone biosynthesis peptide chaperone PqqD [Paracoccaceae bacterium]|nr:pyrroloquinoline quinone biosynthesis peptide chaperone PqqD [Paracoccaceae bacterium]